MADTDSSSRLASLSAVLHSVCAAEAGILAAQEVAAASGAGHKGALWRQLDYARAAVGAARTQAENEEVVIDSDSDSDSEDTAVPSHQLPPSEALLLGSLRNSCCPEIQLANCSHPVQVERNGQDAFVTFNDDLTTAM